VRLLEKRPSDAAGVLSRAMSRIYVENLRGATFDAWQEAYTGGYKSSMGDHRRYFYNRYLQDAGYYEDIEKASKITEFAPGNGEFLASFIQTHPDKELYLVDIAQANLDALEKRFADLPNVVCVLNDAGRLPLADIDSAFSFLLCQSMPRTLWIEHLSEVFRVLRPGGSYVFQFANHPAMSSNDSVPQSISGSQVYAKDNMLQLVGEAGYQEIEIIGPIELQPFKSDAVWYICRALKPIR
jgi:SAM-dependent methyltransferase